MAKKVIKKEMEEKKKLNSSFSRRIGLLSAIAMMFTVVIDLFSLFYNAVVISVIIGALMLPIIFAVMHKKFGEWLDKKVSRKDYLGSVIDAATLSSVFVFSIEKIILSTLSFTKAPIGLVVFALCVFLALPIMVGVALFKKKDAKYNVEE